MNSAQAVGWSELDGFRPVRTVYPDHRSNKP